VISYRALKKLVGETSLERKCRFLFGFALLFLITVSFWLYASRTRRLVEHQQLLTAKMLVPRMLQIRHYTRFIQLELARNKSTPAGSGSSSLPVVEILADSTGSSPTEESGEQIPSPQEKSASPAPATIIQEVDIYSDMLKKLANSSDRTIWILTSAKNEFPESDDGFEARRRFLDSEDPEDEYWLIRDQEDGSRTLIYFAAIRIHDACRRCHQLDGTVAVLEPSADLEKSPNPNPAALAGALGFGTAPTLIDPSAQPKAPLHSIAKIDISLESVDAQLSRNRAVLLATGIVTSFLAMLAAYAIVRYIIVKPVLHLKDVSDEIARGNLNLRADISTGDEFEELSHAFNRMLRHMMTVNDELRSLNDSLDGKVDQLAQANMELFNNNRIKDDFLATISHELRTPLNSILGFSDILQTAANLDDRQKRYVSNIQTSGQTLMVQINDLLDLAKIESGKMELHPGEIRVADILELQVQQIMPLADRKNIDLRIEPPPQPLPPVFQDRSKISQILTNLLSNAIKFTPEGGRVRVASRQLDPEFVEFSVEDTGIGIPLQEQEHIFEKFRQGSTAPGGRDHVKREYEGTGLGLSIVRELARLLGGDVSLRSEFGKGSLFIVRLPVAAPEKKTAEPDEPALESRSSTSLPLITSVDLLTTSDDEQSDEEESHTPLDVQSI
jgi:signal transduction histidine kinase